MTTQAASPKKFKYQNVKSTILDMIGQLDPGAKMPSERELAQENQCNMQTIRKAMSLLVEEGRIERRVGSGTFVTERHSAAPKTRHVGILLHAQADAYALRISSLIDQEAANEKVTLHTQIVHDFDDSANKAIATLKAIGCTCAIVPWLPWDQNQPLAELVRRSDIPLTIPMLLPGLEDHCFATPKTFGQSDIKFIQLAGEYFHEMGYDHIAFIGPLVQGNDIVERKIIGYTQFISKHQLDNLCHLVPMDNHAINALAQKLARFAPKLAVTCFDDSHAIRFITAMHKIGLQAPKDFVILGWGDTSLAPTCDPPLSSLSGNYRVGAKWMLKNAIGLVRGQVMQEPKSVGLKLHLRQSCGGMQLTPETRNQILDKVGLSLRKQSEHES
ncbi:MAG: substrate-binding domain-containing protein [Phycisphaeraceae bacterium JB051]